METEIISEEVQTLEDAFLGNFCQCGHLIENEHRTGFITKQTRCRAINYNGVVLFSCDCSSIRPYKFEIRIVLENKDELSK